jgi:hypothetical protein
MFYVPCLFFLQQLASSDTRVRWRAASALDRAELIAIPLVVVTGSCPIDPHQASMSPGRRLGG